MKQTILEDIIDLEATMINLQDKIDDLTEAIDELQAKVNMCTRINLP